MKRSKKEIKTGKKDNKKRIRDKGKEKKKKRIKMR
jgi:hypothetical protein